MRAVNPLGRLQALVKQYPTQWAAAEALGIKPSYLSDLLHGRRDISDKMLDRLGLQRVITVKPNGRKP